MQRAGALRTWGLCARPLHHRQQPRAVLRIEYMIMTTIELIPISDIYTDGVGAVEVLGGNVRVIYYTWEGPPGDRNKVVVAKLVMPIGAVNERALAKMLSEQLAAQRMVACDETADNRPISGLH
jgi:hypothetical protein